MSKSQMKTVALTIAVLAVTYRVPALKQAVTGDDGGWF